MRSTTLTRFRRYTPAHAKPSTLPKVATTAGLTLSLVPAVVAGTASSASAAQVATAASITKTVAPPAGQVLVPTRVGITDLGRTDARGYAAATTRVISEYGHTYIAGAQVQFQRYIQGSWVTVVTGRTDSTGSLRMAIPVGSASHVRAWVPSQARIEGSLSRAVTKQQTLAQRVLLEARKHYGKAYRYGATGPSRFDCSGFVGYVFRQMGVSLPRSSHQQMLAVRRVPTSAMQPGDLVFTWRGGRVGHVGIYAGKGMMWAATSTGDIVRPQSIYSRNITVGRVG